jgi:mannose/cellobiose epimerase-like protein (N-acyl-D-glucosamine 2-epimerase family)
MYGVGFALYALSTYYHATGNAEAGFLAHATFDSIYARRAVDGGVYPETYDLDFKTELAEPKGNALGHPHGHRSLNVHIHLVEALTAYHALVARATPGVEHMLLRQQRSAEALAAAAELIVGMAKSGPRIAELRDAADAAQPSQNLESKEVWYLPGHCVEATFLVPDAYEVLGEPGPGEVFTEDILKEADRTMVTQNGFQWLPHILVRNDTVSDSAVDMGGSASGGRWSIGKEEWQAEINWWGQMELLNALVHADKRYGGPGTRAGDKYIQRAAITWELVLQRFINATSGALHETLNVTTLSGDGIREFSPWKVCYHTTRALVRSLQALSPEISAAGGAAKLIE